MKKQNIHQNKIKTNKQTNKKQLFLKTRNGNIRSTGQQCTPRLKKVTAMRQLKADHSLTVKATKPKIQWNILRYNKEKLGKKRGNKRSDMVLYVLQTALNRKLQDNV